MTFLDAAEVVLCDAKTTLTAAEITEIALRRGLIHTRGKTPAATMSAALYKAPSKSAIRREFTPGPSRAMRDSVRWTYVRRAS
jgi:HB1, ASXL, restriction endonuclease HTH domain